MSSLAASVSSSSYAPADTTGIVRNSNFDLGNIQFGAPKVNASGGKNVPIYNASAKKGLKGCVIKFPKISVGATENTLIASCFAKGKTKCIVLP